MNQSKRIVSLVLLAVMGNVVAMQEPSVDARHEPEHQAHAHLWAVGCAVGVGAVCYGAHRVIVAYQRRSDRKFVQQQERFVQQMHGFLGNEPSLQQVTNNQKRQVLCALHTRFVKKSGGVYALYHAGMDCAAHLERLEKIYERYENDTAFQEDKQFIEVVKKCIVCEIVVLHIVAMSAEFQAQASAYQNVNGQRSESVLQLIYGIIQKSIDVILDHVARAWDNEGQAHAV